MSGIHSSKRKRPARADRLRRSGTRASPPTLPGPLRSASAAGTGRRPRLGGRFLFLVRPAVAVAAGEDLAASSTKVATAHGFALLETFGYVIGARCYQLHSQV